MASAAKPTPKKLSRRPEIVQTTSVAEAKANFSALVRSVELQRAEIIVKRRGVAVAKIIPFTEPEMPSGYGWMRGRVEVLGDIIGPTGEEWDVRDE
jgi:antitoxin (DNA-binding transcriptional repressor) of toxin-antitoxin stability system